MHWSTHVADRKVVRALRILQMTPSYDPIIGGTETYVKQLAVRLNLCGIETDVMTFNMSTKWRPVWQPDVSCNQGHRVFRIPALGLPAFMPSETGYILETYFKLHVLPNPRFLRQIAEYDLLHFHDDVDMTFPILCHFVNKPKVFHARTLPSTFHSYQNNRLLKRMLAKIADIYIGNSKNTCNLLTKLGIEPGRIRLLYNGIDSQTYMPNEKERVNGLILFVGRLTYPKGLHVLLRSLESLRDHVTVVIVGPSFNDEYSRTLSELMAKVSPRHKFMCLGGLPRKEVVKWYQRASICVCPSFSESFGNISAEALACATPVIASDIEGYRDIITNAENGILVPPGDQYELGKAIQFLIDNPKTRRRLGEKGRMMVRKKFDVSVSIKRLINIYIETAALHNAG
jgi:glycosyltransferase involved in cell wall biosynthesis